MNTGLDKRKVFITGASRGIGKKVKEVFEECGADVTAPGRTELDLSDRDSILNYLKANQTLCPDIFIHCAAINELADIDELELKVLDRVFQVNYYAPVMLLHHFSRHMKQNRWGRIVFLSSVYAIVSRERRSAYASTKHALTGLIKTLTLELASYHVLTNAVAPGYVMTDMTRKNLSEEEICDIKKRIPTGRLQTVEDIANLTVFLCSDFNQSLTGQLIAVDGGFTCR